MMLHQLVTKVLAWALLLAVCFAKPYQVPMMGRLGSSRTLVLLGDMGIIQSHSMYFADLASNGYELTYMQASDSNLVLKKYGENLYDNIIIFAPEIDDFARISFEDFSEFSNDGGNILMAVNENVSEGMRDFAALCGVEFDAQGTAVIDHFAFEKEEDVGMRHTTVDISNVIDSSILVGDYLELPVASKKILYKGIGHAVEESNVHGIKVLRGNPSTYSANPTQNVGDYPENAGADTLLVTVFQGRNNARLLFSGSLDMFSNEFFKPGYGNEAFCTAVSDWTFAKSGILRFRDITHHKSDGTPPDVILHEKERPDQSVTLYPDPEITRNSLVYRIKDELVYSMTVEEYRGGSWQPFYTDDMQLEFVMLDPYVRTNMKPDKSSGKMVGKFIAPDDYGIFKFRVMYRREGYSILHTEETVSVRPFKHDEYERYISTAYPYYASTFSGVIAFLVFTLFFLYSKDS